MKLSQLRNPYNFANPVQDHSTFAGRDEELKEAKYYITEASQAQYPINIAIIGERASGKTSFLNIVGLEAIKSGFCIVRIDLDESDAESQMAFFFKIFDSLITEICTQGAFGGIDGVTYGTYRDAVDAFEIPVSKEFCPFAFPLQYARAMSANNHAANVSSSVIKRDLTLIRSEVNRPIALLFDECDVLTKSNIHLQMIRNIFMNMAGYFLVLTGTEKLFPVMNEVFSPIIRQFKKINIKPFARTEETEQCIFKPLYALNMKPTDVLDLETYSDVRQIHQLSGGKPYEIQLLCHFLFRRIQQGQSEIMQLTVDVLDDVLRELQTDQDLSARPAIRGIRRLNTDELHAFKALSACRGSTPVAQIEFVEAVLGNDPLLATSGDIRAQLQRFVEMRILAVDEPSGEIRFPGDDFDKIYCKYLARKSNVDLMVAAHHADAYPGIRLLEKLAHIIDGASFFPNIVTSTEVSRAQLGETLANLRNGNFTAQDLRNVLPYGVDVYSALVGTSVKPSMMRSYFVTFVTPWVTLNVLAPCSVDAENEVVEILGDTRLKALANGGDLEWQTYDGSKIDPVKLTNAAKEIGGFYAMNAAVFHSGAMREAYETNGDIELALIHAEASVLLNRDADACNNLGYLLMKTGNWHQAEDYFLEAVQLAPAQPLPVYNLAVANVAQGKYAEAMKYLASAVEQSDNVPDDERSMLCLFIPEQSEHGGLNLVEVFHPDLHDTASDARKLLAEFIEVSTRSPHS